MLQEKRSPLPRLPAASAVLPACRPGGRRAAHHRRGGPAAVRRLAAVVDQRGIRRQAARRHQGLRPGPEDGARGAVRPSPPGWHSSAAYGPATVAAEPAAGGTIGILYVPRFGADYTRPIVQGTTAGGAGFAGDRPLHGHGDARRGGEFRGGRAPADPRSRAGQHRCPGARRQDLRPDQGRLLRLLSSGTARSFCPPERMSCCRSRPSRRPHRRKVTSR